MNDYSRIARRTTGTLFAALSLVSAAYGTMGTVNAVVAAGLSRSQASAGIPSSVLQLGAAFAALAIAASMDRYGRRRGLALGLAVGVVGIGLAVGAMVAGSFLLFLAGSLLLGVASAASRLARFAAAEVHPPEGRGRAIAHVVLGGVVGSVVGALLIGPSGRWMKQMGLSELLGPFVAAMVLLALATVVIHLWLRPDPRDVGQEISRLYPESGMHPGPARPPAQILRSPAGLVALSAMLFSQVVMAMMMGMTSLHMANHQRAMAGISVVFAAHMLGMYALSTVAGRLTDRWGRGPAILLGSGMLVLACWLATLSSDVLPLSVALFLLGVGWNFCYVGGSALLSDQLSPQERARTQGANDFVVGLATAGASAGSGLIFAGASYAVLGFTGAVASLVPVGLIAYYNWPRKRESFAPCAPGQRVIC